METSDWLFHFGGQGGHRLLHKPFRTKWFTGIGCVAQTFCVAFGGTSVQQFLPVLGTAQLMPEGHVQDVAVDPSTQMGSRAEPAKPLGRFHQTGTKNSGKPKPAAKIFGRNEAVENVRLLRLEDYEIARNATPVKATLTARGSRAAWTAAASRAEELIWRRRRRKGRPEVALSVDRGSRLMEGCPLLVSLKSCVIGRPQT